MSIISELSKNIIKTIHIYIYMYIYIHIFQEIHTYIYIYLFMSIQRIICKYSSQIISSYILGLGFQGSC